MVKLLLKHYLYSRSIDMLFDRMTSNLHQRPRLKLRGTWYRTSYGKEAYIKDLFARAHELRKAVCNDYNRKSEKFIDRGRIIN